MPTPGTHVTLLKDVDLRPHCIVRAGATGTIVKSDEDFVDVKLDRAHAGLCAFDNTAWLCRDYDNVAEYLRPSRAQRRPRSYALAACIAFAVAIVGSAIFGPDAARALRGPALEVVDMHLATTVYHPGDKLDLVMTARRLRVCALTWTHTWKDVVTSQFVASDVDPGSATAIKGTPETYHVHVATPRGLRNGTYSMTSAYRADCDHSDVLTGTLTPVYFTVE